MNTHKQTYHTDLKVDIIIEDQIQLACDMCDFKCGLNVILRKHKKTVHEEDRSERDQIDIMCDRCDYRCR